MKRFTFPNTNSLKKQYILATVYLAITLVLGLTVTFLPVTQFDYAILIYLQTAVPNSIGILPFQILTYLGDTYVWIAIAAIYFVYAFVKSQKNLTSAVELAVFLLIVSLLTVALKVGFNRARPDPSKVTVYSAESDPSYPSGHVSRATGGFAILSNKKRVAQALASVAVFAVALTRMILGLHFLTDVIGAVFLSLAAQNIAKILTTQLRLIERLHCLQKWCSGQDSNLRTPTGKDFPS